MKKVKFTDGNCFSNFEDMLENCSYPFIGFQAKEMGKDYRYFIVKGEDYRGLAIRPRSIWVPKERQCLEKGNYFGFEKENDLFSWLVGFDVGIKIIPLYISSLKENNENLVFVKDFKTLIDTYNYIGFIPNDNKKRQKYFILGQGSYRGVAICNDLQNTWSTKEQQKDYKEIYFVFDTFSEMVKWLEFVN